MRILGVDPGLRNLGVAIIDNGEVLLHALLRNDETEGITSYECLRYYLPLVAKVVKRFKPEAAAVEGVVWQGRANRRMIPLAVVAGGIAGLLWAQGLDVFLLSPQQKGRQARPPRGWTDHEGDALLLAKKVQEYFAAVSAGDVSDPRSQGIGTHRITTAKSVPGQPSRSALRTSRKRPRRIKGCE